MITDFHTHIFPPYFKKRRQTLFSNEPAFEAIYRPPQAKVVGAKELLRDMDEEKVQRSVIFGFPWENPEHYRRHNDYILESVDRYPGRLIGFCCVTPLPPPWMGCV